MGDSLVSVIVPVYGVEAYLEACVESILAQSYRNLEIILVDDGSPDGCPALCDACAVRDGRVRVIHQVNGGLSAARNAGLDAAHGDWLAFVDADDVVAPRFIESLMGAVEGGGVDIVQCGFCTERGRLGETAEPRFEYLTGYGASERLQFDSTGAYTVVWNKLYARSLFAELRFPEGRQHEDEFVTYRALWAAGGVGVTDACLYFYRQRRDSTMGAGVGPKSLDAVEALCGRAAFYRAAGEERLAALTEAVACHRLAGMLPALARTLPGSAVQRWRKEARELFGRVMRAPEVGVGKKAGLAVRMLAVKVRGLRR